MGLLSSWRCRSEVKLALTWETLSINAMLEAESDQRFMVTLPKIFHRNETFLEAFKNLEDVGLLAGQNAMVWTRVVEAPKKKVPRTGASGAF